MKLVIFGATGGTGRCVVEQALAAEHEVTALVRNVAAMPLQHARLRLLAGNVLNANEVDAAIAGQDVVVSALGSNVRGVMTLCANGSRNILAAMQKQGVKRLVTVSAYGAADSHHRNLYNFMLWLTLKEKILDKERMEALIKNSAVDWTVVRPPYLTNGARTGRYRVGSDLHMSIISHISRADVADFILHHLTDAATFRQTLAITT